MSDVATAVEVIDEGLGQNLIAIPSEYYINFMFFINCM